jgi:hypothetical protein
MLYDADNQALLLTLSSTLSSQTIGSPEESEYDYFVRKCKSVLADPNFL